MSDICEEVEISVRVKNEPGLLAGLFDALAEAGIEILARRSHRDGEWNVLLFVPDNASKTQRVLEERGLSYGTDSVVLADVESPFGSGARYGARLRAEGIGVLYSYVWASEANRVFAVFKTMDDARAVHVLREISLVGT